MKSAVKHWIVFGQSWRRWFN